MFLYCDQSCTEVCVPFPTDLPWQQGSWGQHGAHLGPTGPSVLTFCFDVRCTRLYVFIFRPYSCINTTDNTVVIRIWTSIRNTTFPSLYYMSDTYIYIYLALAECYKYITLALWWWLMRGHYDFRATLRMVSSFVQEIYEIIFHVKCIEIYATHLYWILADYFQMICIWLLHCMWLILRCFKYHMNIMLVIID